MTNTSINTNINIINILHQMREAQGLETTSPGTNPGTSRQMNPSKAIQETLEIIQGGGRDQEKGTRPRRDIKLESLKIKEEENHMRGGQGMPQDTGIEKHPERDMGTGGREGAA